MLNKIKSCPLHSLMKATTKPCRGLDCAWWIKGKDGRDSGCAFAMMARFFEERSWPGGK